jgi:HAD superfamily hydrolase (TIGR01509 family)
VHLLPLSRHLSLERGEVATIDSTPRLAVAAITFDFGNTLVRVDRTGLRAVTSATAAHLRRGGSIDDEAAFMSIWSDERERQFREEVPRFREVDMAQRITRVLARLRGAARPADDAAWDDELARNLVSADEVASTVEAYSAAFVASMPVIPEAGGVLERLAARGFRLAILSNWPVAETIDRYAAAMGWDRHLRTIVVSQRVGVIKPHPAIFLHAASALGVPPAAILHVGDDWAADVAGALAAGWRAAYLRDRQADTPLPTSEPDDVLVPDLVLGSLAEIEPAVELLT